MKVALFNDTGNFPHVGCLGVSNAHNKLLQQAGLNVHYRFFVDQLHWLWQGNREQTAQKVATSFLYEIINDCDAIIVNGEGTIHHGAGLHLLAILEFAQLLDKPTHLINAVMQEIPEYLDVLRRLKSCSVRDLKSSRYLDSLEIPHDIIVDSIIHADFDSSNTSPASKSLMFTDCHHSRGDMKSLLQNFAQRFSATYYPVEYPEAFTQWRKSIINLQGSSLVVTGRLHAIYLCALARVPFIALPSNSWKIEGTFALFNQASGHNVEVFSKPEITQEDITEVLDNRQLYEDFSDFILTQRDKSALDVLNL